jgi:hypothetical protein
MKKLLVLTSVVLSACSTATPPPGAAQTVVQAQAASATQAEPRAQAPTPPQEQAPRGGAPAPEELGLTDLNAMTFSCAKAGLNAAAREAAKASARGSYQFAYFRIVSSSHHSSYEVHFKSNNYEDPELKYCVSIYCQQGWNPKTANLSVNLMSKATPPARAATAGAGHVEECGEHSTRAKRRVKR